MRKRSPEFCRDWIVDASVTLSDWGAMDLQILRECVFVAGGIGWNVSIVLIVRAIEFR